MSDREKCNSCFFRDTSFFRDTALLHLPQAWRGAVRQLGETLDDVTLEIWGLVPEAPDSLATTVARLHAIAADLCVCGQQLEDLAAEPDAAQLVEAEVRLCELAGRMAPQVKELARRLAAVG